MKVNQLKVGAMLSYVSMILGYIISILYTPIMLRLLGQSEYGLYNLVSSVVSYLGLLSFGLGSAYMKYYSVYKANNQKIHIKKLNGMFLIVFSIISIVSLIVGLIFVKKIDFILGGKLLPSELATAKVLMGIMVINIAISFPLSIFDFYIIANENYIFQKLLQMLRTIINPLIMLPILLMGYKSIGMVAVTTVITLLIGLSNIIFCFKKLKIQFTFKKIEISLMKEISIFSSYIFINMIIDQINWNVDKFILGKFRGTASVAIYGIASQLNTYYLTLSTSISNVFIPRVNRMEALKTNNEEFTSLFTRVGRIQFIILSLILSGIIIFGKPFIIMWAGKDYIDAYEILLLLIIPVTIPLIQNIGIEIQKAKNMHKFRSIIYLFISIFNILMSIPLTKMYGGKGAALGTAISLIIGNCIIMNWYYHMRVGLNMRYFWKEIIKFSRALIAPTIIGIIISFANLYDIPTFLLTGFIYVLIFSLSMWLLGMNKYEKDLFRKPVMKILQKLR